MIQRHLKFFWYILPVTLFFADSSCLKEIKHDPWGFAHGMVQEFQVSVLATDAAFYGWYQNQVDKTKAQQARQKYETLRKTVLQALELAESMIELSRQAEQEPNLLEIMKDVRKLMTELVDFLQVLLQVR